MISRVICQSFACKAFDGIDYELLAADLAVACDSERYELMVVYASITLILFSIGVPSALIVSLFRLMPSRFLPTPTSA